MSRFRTKTESELFLSAVQTFIPRAKAMVDVRGWEDPRPEFVIWLPNGVEFRGFKKHDVLHDAHTYWLITQDILGATS